MFLGSAAAVSAAQARESASEICAKVRLGQDPAGAKIASRTATTVAEAVRNYLAHQRAHMRARSYAEVERHLLKNLKSLHGLPLTAVDRRAVAARISTIVTNNGPVAANRTRSTLAAFFAWCLSEGLADINPVVGTGTQAEKPRDRVLDDLELAAIWNATADDTDYSAIIRLLMLTGQRAGEIGGLRWSEIAGNEIRLPGSRTKNGRAHTVPLAPAALAILEGRPHHGEYVFGRSGFKGWEPQKAALDQRLGGELPHWVNHDIRRSAATGMAEIGIQPHIIEAILNHVSGHQGGTAGIYNRATYEPQKRIALQKWADHLNTIVTGKQPDDTIVQLHA
jgi:integrase